MSLPVKFKNESSATPYSMNFVETDAAPRESVMEIEKQQPLPIEMINYKLGNFQNKVMVDELTLQTDAIEESKPPQQADISRVQMAVEKLAIELGEILNKKQGVSFCFSPANIVPVLGMILKGLGNRFEEKQKMLKALHLEGMKESCVHSSLAILMKQIPESGKAIISTAAGVAVKGIPLSSYYVDTIRKIYESEVFETENLVDSVNEWVFRKTMGMIPKILSNEATANEGVALINALSFKAEFLKKFNKSKTSERPFRFEDGGKENVLMMQQHSSFQMYETRSFRMLAMPYAVTDNNVDKLTQLFFLPNDDQSCSDVFEFLKSHSIKDCQNAAKEQMLDVCIPRVHVESTIDLLPVLKNDMNFPLNESLRAMGSSQKNSENLQVDLIQHSISFDTDEDGTKAAAATVAMISKGITNSFEVNRPYVYAMMKNDSILFMGAIKDKSSLVNHMKAQMMAPKIQEKLLDVGSFVHGNSCVKPIFVQMQALYPYFNVTTPVSIKELTTPSGIKLQIINFTYHNVSVDNSEKLSINGEPVVWENSYDGITDEKVSYPSYSTCYEDCQIVVFVNSEGKLFCMTKEMKGLNAARIRYFSLGRHDEKWCHQFIHQYQSTYSEVRFLGNDFIEKNEDIKIVLNKLQKIHSYFNVTTPVSIKEFITSDNTKFHIVNYTGYDVVFDGGRNLLINGKPVFYDYPILSRKVSFTPDDCQLVVFTTSNGNLYYLEKDVGKDSIHHSSMVKEQNEWIAKGVK